MNAKDNGAVSVAETLHTSTDDNYALVRMSDGRIGYLFNPAIKLRPSKTGKTMLVSTTSGPLALAGLPAFSANAYRSN